MGLKPLGDHKGLRQERTVPSELWVLSEWAVKEIGDCVRSRGALFRMEETWVCFQHEEEEPGERQKLEIREMGDNCLGRDGMKSTEEQTSLARPPLPLGSLLQIPTWPGSSQLVVPQGNRLKQCYSKSVLGPEALYHLGSWLPNLWPCFHIYWITICTLARACSSLRSAGLKQWL